MNENATLDAILGPPDSPWRGGERTGTNTRTAIGLGASRAERRSQLLPALVALQEAHGWISPDAVAELAARLDVSRAEIWGVVTFYSLLETDPSETPTWICTDIACPDGEERCESTPGGRASPCLGQCDSRAGTFRWGDDLPTAPLIRERGPLLSGDGKGVGIPAPETILAAVEASGIVGRGGAAFPVGVKWRSAANTPADQRYVVCNADESEPGTFKDRALALTQPDLVVEGMVLAAHAIGASRGYLYVRAEYPDVRAALEAAAQACDSLEIEVRSGAGAYICGEETALLNSIEGKRGEPRAKPPFPTQVGLFGRPTVINNVETLANIPRIVAGTAPDTKLFSISGDVARPGVYELPLGTPLPELLQRAGAVDDPYVLLGGASGSFLPPAEQNLALSFTTATLGSGAVIVFAPDTDFDRVTARIAEFFAEESCGQCVPCRVGTSQQVTLLGEGRFDLLGDVDRVMTDASICGLGQTAASAIRSALRLGLIGGDRD